MRAAANSIIVERPVGEVFAFVTDATNNHLWQVSCGLRQIRQEPDGSVGVGTRVAEVWHYLGRTIETASEVTAFEPNRKYVRHALGMAGPIKQADFTFEPVMQGTRWTAAVYLQASGPLAIAELALASRLKWRLSEHMTQAKALLEQGYKAYANSA
jgi:uncharacterized protein YndB with AHSA1/START domain